MDDADKLSAPAFEPFESGVELRRSGQRLGDRAGCPPQRPLRDDHRRHRRSSGYTISVLRVLDAPVRPLPRRRRDRASPRSRSPTRRSSSRSRPRSTSPASSSRRRQPGRQHARSPACRRSAATPRPTAHLADAMRRRPGAREHDPRHPVRGGQRGGMSAHRSRPTRSCRGPARGSASRSQEADQDAVRRRSAATIA